MVLAVLGATNGASAAAPAADTSSEALRTCATGHALDLAVVEPDNTAEHVSETALQLCYQENLEAQTEFRAAQLRVDRSIGADELVARWDVHRSELRTSLVAAINSCRASLAAGAARCDPS